MRRLVFGLVAAMACLVASDASACHKKKVACAPAPVCEPVCMPEPTCAPAPKKKCFKMPKFKFGCHKRQVACEVVETCAPCETTTWAAPQTAWAAPQHMAAPQSMMLPVPQK